MADFQEIMTVAEVADFLKLSEKTVLKMIRQKEIPCTKIANQWRFSRSILENWLNGRIQGESISEVSQIISKGSEHFPLSRLIAAENIIEELQTEAPNSVLAELSDNAFETGLISNRDLFLEKLLEREAMTSTAMGNGIALPHMREPSEAMVHDPRIVIGRSSRGIDFGAQDGTPTKLFFLILADSTTVHLRIISRLAAVLKEAPQREELLRCRGADDYLRAFLEIERGELF